LVPLGKNTKANRIGLGRFGMAAKALWRGSIDSSKGKPIAAPAPRSNVLLEIVRIF
jgi:hypothetical protein